MILRERPALRLLRVQFHPQHSYKTHRVFTHAKRYCSDTEHVKRVQNAPSHVEHHGSIPPVGYPVRPIRSYKAFLKVFHFARFRRQSRRRVALQNLAADELWLWLQRKSSSARLVNDPVTSCALLGKSTPSSNSPLTHWPMRTNNVVSGRSPWALGHRRNRLHLQDED